MRALVTGRFGERFADELVALGIPLIATVTLVANPVWIGLIKAGLFAAPLAIALHAGQWADRFSPRRLMIAGPTTRIVVMVAIAGLYWAGWLSVWWLLVVAVLDGAAATLYRIANASAVPALVEPGTLRAVNSRIDAGGHVATALGPLAGGGIGQALAAPLIPVAAAVALAVTAVSAWRLPEPRRVIHPHRPSIGEGLSYVFADPLQRRILLRGATANLGILVIIVLFPIVVIRDLGYNALVLGVLLSVSGAGGILGAALGPRLARRFGDGGVVPVTAIAAGVFAMGYPAALMLPKPWDFVGLLIADTLAFTASIAYNVAQRTLRQEICPPQMQGRMNASMHFVILSTAPMGALGGGALAAAFGLHTAYWIGATIVLASASVVVFSPLWGLRELPAPA
jgi:MFS family permease